MFLNRQTVSFCFFLVLSFALFIPKGHAQFKVIGYYPTYAGGYPTGINSLDLAKLTHVYIAFANPDATGTLLPDYGTAANINTVVTACHTKGLKVFMSIGGGGASGTNYQTLLSSTANINAFVTKIITFATSHNLDGIDVDIEGNILDGSTLTAAQYQNFVTALSTALHANNLKISAALGTWFGGFVTSTAAAQFDWINMMSYDLYGTWTGPGQHAPYSMTTSDFQYWNTTKGVPASKLIVGLPFYGYGWGTYPHAGLTYCDIINNYGGSSTADQVGSGANVIYYNGIPTIKQKTTYATQHAAGVMIWEITQDCATTDSRSLLLAVSQVLAPLPVTWVNFDATSTQQGIQLNWSTAQEKNNAYFMIESSTDGISFQKIARILAVGNSNSLQSYTYLDAQPLSDKVYYRIQQVDVDGQYTYSTIVFVQLNSFTPALFDVYPNPSSAENIRVTFHQATKQRLEVMDLWGELYYSQVVTAAQAKETITLSLPALRPGIYLLSATGEGTIYKTKIVIQ